MAWVEITSEARDLDHVLASHSLNPEALAAHNHLYRVVMFGPSGLSRMEREAMAVAVSAAKCPQADAGALGDERTGSRADARRRTLGQGHRGRQSGSGLLQLR